MSLREQRDPDLELLSRLPPMPLAPEAVARARRRCHDAMALRATRHGGHQSDIGPGRWPDAVLALSMSAYLVAAVSTALRLAGSP